MSRSPGPLARKRPLLHSVGDAPGDIERLRKGSRRLARLNSTFAESLNQLAGATVRLYRHNRHLEDAEGRLRACLAALALTTSRTGRGR